jgi:hypothetical protein
MGCSPRYRPGAIRPFAGATFARSDGATGPGASCSARRRRPGLCPAREREYRGRKLRKIEEAAFVEFPRLRLPLPERTGSDRDELLCPHGFVDRAYSVFLRRLRCCEPVLLITYDCDSLCIRPPRWSCCDLEPGSHSRANLTRGVNEGTSPRALARPSLRTAVAPSPLRWWPGRPRADGGARPARDASELPRSRSPTGISRHLGRVRCRAHIPYPKVDQSRACANSLRTRRQLLQHALLWLDTMS